MGIQSRNYLDSADHEWYKHRVTGLMAGIFAVFIALYARLFYLQAIEGEEYRRLSENNCIRLQHINAPRGLIFDRSGQLLVDNRPSFDLGIVLKDAKPLDDTLFKLSNYTHLDYDESKAVLDRKKVKPKYKPIWLKKDIGRDVLATVEVHKFDLPGVIIDTKPRRHYINKQNAAHFLGYLGEINTDELKNGEHPDALSGDYIGKFGVEKTFEPFLRGTRGGQQVEVNAKGRVVRVMKTVNAQAGNNIYLTLDMNLQKKAEALLKDKAGGIVAIDPNSGEILAMASSPAFDQNLFVSGLSHKKWKELISNPFRPMENKSIQGEYPPGSIYKIVTAMAGLEERVVNSNTTFFCPGQYKLGDRVFRCWKRGGHGTVNISKALTESCDVYFYQVGQKIGVDRLAWYAKACGLGAVTRIRLDHEAKGLIPTASWKKHRIGIPWQRGETLSIAIGQGYNLVTPLQLAILTSAMANGGIRYNPLILKTIQTAEGKSIRTAEKQVVGRLPISKRNMHIIRKGLWAVVNSSRGTARISKIKGIEMSGKTGTAQVFSRKTNDTMKEEDIADHLKSHAWFVAYAPSKDPQIAISIIVEHGAHGSSTASPIAKKLVMTYLGIAEDTIPLPSEENG